MELSLDRVDFLCGLLKSATVAAIVIAHPVSASALTTQDIPQMTSLTGVSVDGSLGK
jgi:hypothetical protein